MEYLENVKIKIGLNEEFCKNLIKEITLFKIPEKIVLFGSRAGDHFKETSDIDLAIFGKDWTSTDINLLKDRLEENIKTPLKIDLLNFYAITKEGLRQNIQKSGVILHESK